MTSTRLAAGLVGEVPDLLTDLRAEGMTMVLSTDEMGLARQAVDLVCFLDGWRILEQGPPARVLDTPQEPRTQRFLARLVAREGATERARRSRRALSWRRGSRCNPRRRHRRTSCRSAR